MKLKIDEHKTGKTIEIELDEGEKSVTCPNCSGTGQDLSTMICTMCGGDGELFNEF